MKQNHLIVKATAAILVLTFSSSQIVWAVDVRQMLLDAKTFFDEQDAQRPHGMTSEELAAAEAQQQSQVEQQQMLEDFQNTTFSLTTPNGDVLKYVGDKLDSVQRPDGTQLNNILTDAVGNIQEADLRLADGSIQVYQNGQVIGYMTPDGSQVIYENGEVKKVIDKNGVETLYAYTKNAQGAVTETVLNNPTYLTKYDANGKIKEATRKSDNQKIFYTNGMIQLIENPDGSQVVFTSQSVGGDTILTPQGGGGATSNIFIDPAGNKFNFTAGSVSSIVLTDGSTLDNLVWDSSNKIDSANLTETNGEKYIYQAKKLTRSYDTANVVANYTYNSTSIIVSKAGNTWEYLLDKTPVKYTSLTGDVATYNQSGTYKGLKATETIAGVLYTYEYTGSGATLSAQKRRAGGETVALPNTLYQTTARSVLSWSGGPAWFSYEQPYGKDYLQTHWAGQWVEYTVNMSQAGDLKIALETSDSNALPAGYTNFQLELSVDGAVKSTMNVPATANSIWQAGTATLTGLTQGNHIIRVKFNNFASAGGQQTDFKFRNIAFTRITATTVTPVSSGYQATPLTSRLDTIKNSTIIKPIAPSAVSSTDFTSITYDSASRLKQALFKDGSKLLFDQGILKQAYDPAGKLTSFDFQQSALSNVVGSSIVQSNLISTYSADGKLSSIKTEGLTVHYKSDRTIEVIEKSDGTELWDPVFDTGGNLKDALIIAPDGEERQYVNGKLAELRRPDQSKLFYANDKVAKMVTPENFTYNFTYTPTKIEAVMLQGVTVPDALTPVRMEYDLSFNLKKVVRQNQEVLNYLNTDLTQIDAPNTASKVFNYQKDIAGKVLSYTVTQGNTVTYYDANNQPTRAVISPDASNPHTFDISYQYGKMREVKKNGVVTFNYSYLFDASGVEHTVVQDLESNTTKTYRDKELVSSLDKQTNVLSSYEYQSGKVSQVAVSRFGRTLHIYDYSYSGTSTIVADETGVKRTYNSDQKLLFLEKDGQKFAYTYTNQTVTTQNGPPVTTETLLPNTLYQTTARSVLSWNGGQAWFSYEQPYGKDYLQTHWAGQWVEYTVNMGQAGDLKLALETSDSNALPAGYANFQLELSVDGAVKGTMSVPATGNNVWQGGTATLTGLSQGNHIVRVKFNNYLSSGGQQTDFRFRNISFKRLTTTSSSTTQQVNIVSEDMVERRLADGSLVHYSGGRVNRIDYADGRILKDIIEDGEGGIKELRLLTSAQDSVGTKVEFADGIISKLTLSGGQQLTYSYDHDANGVVVTTWVRKGTALLKYDAQGTLTGMKVDGVMTPQEVHDASTHTYPQGYFGSSSVDGDFTTSQWNSIGCVGVGGCGATAESQHNFPAAQTLTGITFQMAVSAYASGNYIRDHNASYYVEVLRNGTWQAIPGSTWGCGGGDGSCSRNSGVVNLAGLNLDNVMAIRAHAHGFGNASGGEGSSGGGANIYEIQYFLADLANLSFSTTTGTGGAVTGYTFTGHKGTFKYDAQGNLTQSNSAYTLIQQELTGLIQKVSALPFESVDFLDVHVLAADGETIVSQEYSEDGTLETQTKADGTVTLYENNKPSKVLDRKGEVLVQYAYDAQGNPTRIYLKHARDSLPDEVLKARQGIEAQRAEALRNLAAQRNLAYQSIQNQYRDAQAALTAQISQQETNYNNLSGNSAKGKAAKNAKADVLGQISGGIDTLRGQLIGFYEQEADAYANLDSQVLALSNQIEVDTATAVTGLSTQEANMKREILRQEVSPIVYDYYRRILGRDPDTNEYNSWINQIDYNSGSSLAEVKTTGGINLTSALTSHINALPELAQRQAYVTAIKTAVTSQINSYLAMTQAQKEAYAATLGLTPQDLIPLSQVDVTAILNWINTRSLHFGQSAFLALESLLDQKGKVYTRETLARQAILIDVLTGVISPLDDGDLVISVFALNKVAGLYGVTLTGANLSWDDLKAIVPATATATSPRVIAHINGNHYVIVTAMTADSITYIDPGIGKDKQNESITVSKAGFLKVWQGNVTLNQVDFNSIKTIRGASTQAKVLSAMEAKNIRGAFWGSLLGLIGSILTWIPGLNGIGLILTGISAAVSAIEGDWISAISSLVTLGLGSFGDALKGAFNSVVGAMGPLGQVFQAAGNIIGGVYNAVTGLVGNLTSALGGFFQGFGVGAHLATNIARTAVATGMSVAVSKGFEALGVNPVIAGFAGALAGGFAIGASQADTTVIVAGKSYTPITQGQFIQQSLTQVVTLANVGNLGMQLGLDPTFTNIVGLSLGAIQGTVITNPTTTLQQAFSFVKPQLVNSLTQYGVQKLGDSLGIDTRISGLIGAPILGALSSGLSGGKDVGQNIIQSVQSSLIHGAVTYGVEFVGQTSPILGSLLSQDIARNIELAIGRDGLFGTVFNILQRSVLNVVNVVGGAVQSVFQGISSFAGEIQQKGMAGALESNRDALFNRSTQEAILAKGGVQNVLNTTPKISITLQNGQSAQELKISGTSSLYFDAAGNLIGKKEDGVTQIGSYYKDPTTGKVALQNGTVYADIQTDLDMTTTVKDGQATSIRIEGPSNQQLVTIDPEKANTPIRIEGPSQTSSFNIWGAIFSLAPLAISFAMNQGVAYAAQITESAPVSQPTTSNATTLFALVNGILNSESDLTKSPDYINNFENDIAGSSNGQYVAGRDFMKSAIYQNFMMNFNPLLNSVENQMKDVLNLFFEAVSPIVHFASTLKIMMDFDNRFRLVPSDETRPIVAMGYSGGFLPLIEAIQTRHYNTDTLIGLGAATTAPLNVPFEDITKILNYILFGQMGDAVTTLAKYLGGIKDISQLGIKRVVNIWGTNDILAQMGIAGKRSSVGGVLTYNIEIAGASHFDYMRRSGETDPVKELFNLKVSKFVTDLTLASKNDLDLVAFLQRTMGAPDPDGVWRFRP